MGKYVGNPSAIKNISETKGELKKELFFLVKRKG